MQIRRVRSYIFLSLLFQCPFLLLFLFFCRFQHVHGLGGVRERAGERKWTEWERKQSKKREKQKSITSWKKGRRESVEERYMNAHSNILLCTYACVCVRVSLANYCVCKGVHWVCIPALQLLEPVLQELRPPSLFSQLASSKTQGIRKGPFHFSDGVTVSRSQPCAYACVRCSFRDQIEVCWRVFFSYLTVLLPSSTFQVLGNPSLFLLLLPFWRSHGLGPSLLDAVGSPFAFQTDRYSLFSLFQIVWPKLTYPDTWKERSCQSKAWVDVHRACVGQLRLKYRTSLPHFDRPARIVRAGWSCCFFLSLSHSFDGTFRC